MFQWFMHVANKILSYLIKIIITLQESIESQHRVYEITLSSKHVSMNIFLNH